ncbi:unnamed protein product, partial [Iphiclides podalirius]
MRGRDRVRIGARVARPKDSACCLQRLLPLLYPAPACPLVVIRIIKNMYHDMAQGRARLRVARSSATACLVEACGRAAFSAEGGARDPVYFRRPYSRSHTGLHSTADNFSR